MPDGVVEHLPEVVELGLAVRVRVVDPPVDNPVVAGVEVDEQAVDHADAFDHHVFVAAIHWRRTSHEFYFKRVAFVEDAAVDYQAGILAVTAGGQGRQPDDRRGYLVVHKISVNRIVREVSVVVGHVGLCVAYLG